MTSEDQDQTDRIQQLEQRIEELENKQQLSKTSRRGLLGGIVGVAGLGAMSGSGAAASGQVGTANNRVNVFADTVDANQLTGVSTGGIKTKTRAFLSTASSASPIPFDSVSYDPDNNFDTSTHEYTVPADGTYQVSVNIRLDSSVSSGRRAIFEIRVSGSTIAETELTKQSQFPTISQTDIRELTGGDSIKLLNKKGVNVLQGEEDSFLSVLRLE